MSLPDKTLSSESGESDGILRSTVKAEKKCV